MEETNGTFLEYKRLILKGLETVDADIRALRHDLSDTKEQLQKDIHALDRTIVSLSGNTKRNSAVIAGAVGIVAAGVFQLVLWALNQAG